MARFEIQANGKRFEVEAPDMQSAVAALSQHSAQSLQDRFATAFDPSADSQSTQDALDARTQRGSIADPLIQGLTFGFGDEIAGGIGGLMSAAEGKGFGPGYEKVRDAKRADLAFYRERHPVASTAAEVIGALPTLAIPGGAVARGAGMGARIAGGVISGAVAGGLQGAGSAEGGIGERAAGAGTGMVAGGILGGLAPVAVRGAQAAWRGVRDTIGAPIRGALNAEKEAARRIATASEIDARAPGARLTAADEAAAAQNGQPIYNFDRGGETTLALMRSAANAAPNARGAINQAIGDRFQGQGDRTIDVVRRIVGGQSTDAAKQGLQAAARAANRPAYQRAYAAGDRSIISPELERLLGSPAVVDAMRTAATKGKNLATAEGFGAFKAGVRVTPDGQVLFQRGPSGVPTYPNIQFWDYTHRELRDAAEAARRAGRNSEATALGTLAKQMRTELDRIVPEFGQARSTAAHYFGAQDALEAGDKFVMSRMANNEARRGLAQMNPAERQLFAEGFADSLVRRISEVGDRRNVINSLFLTSPASRERIEMALGPARARELESFLRVEDILDKARGAMSNSTTARQLVELGLAGGSGVYGLTTGDWRPNALVLTGILLRHGGGRIDRRVAERVGMMLASQDATIVQRGLHAVARSERMINALRRADIPLATATGQQSSERANQMRRPLEITVPVRAGVR